MFPGAGETIPRMDLVMKLRKLDTPANNELDEDLPTVTFSQPKEHTHSHALTPLPVITCHERQVCHLCFLTFSTATLVVE